MFLLFVILFQSPGQFVFLWSMRENWSLISDSYVTDFMSLVHKEVLLFLRFVSAIDCFPVLCFFFVPFSGFESSQCCFLDLFNFFAVTDLQHSGTRWEAMFKSWVLSCEPLVSLAESLQKPNVMFVV